MAVAKFHDSWAIAVRPGPATADSEAVAAAIRSQFTRLKEPRIAFPLRRSAHLPQAIGTGSGIREVQATPRRVLTGDARRRARRGGGNRRWRRRAGARRGLGGLPLIIIVFRQ